MVKLDIEKPEAVEPSLAQNQASYYDNVRLFFNETNGVLKIDIESNGCANMCAGKGCSFCYNDLERLDRDHPVTPDEAEQDLMEIINQEYGGIDAMNDNPDIKRVLIGSHGDPLDKREVPRETLYKVLEIAKQIRGKKVLFETHANNFYGQDGDELLDAIAEAFPAGGAIEMGLESSSQKVRSEYIASHKGYSNKHYLEVVKKAQARNLDVDSHVFVGLPYQTTRQQVDGAVETMGFVYKNIIEQNNRNGANGMVLFTYNDKETTASSGDGVPDISAWMLLEVLRQAADKYGADILDHLGFAWYGNRKATKEHDGFESTPPLTCDKCEAKVGGRSLADGAPNLDDFFVQFKSAETAQDKYDVIFKYLCERPCDCYEKMMAEYQDPEHSQQTLAARRAWQSKCNREIIENTIQFGEFAINSYGQMIDK
jgi:sugar phosphate isomerase/epimerase